MPRYVFEAPGDDQVFAPGDEIRFLSQPHGGAQTSVRYLPDGRAIVFIAERMFTFNAGVTNQGAVSFSDGSEVFVGGQGGDTAAGGAGDDGLYGGQGEDSLAGGDGDDLLQGNQGRDTLAGGPGDDTVYGGQGADQIDVGAGVNFAHGNMGADTISAGLDAGPSTLLGGQSGDRLAGGPGADLLNGNLGPDTLTGGGGADVMLGENGPDVFVIGAGSSFADPLGEDRIEGWSGEDSLDLPFAVQYAEVSSLAPLDYAAAREEAGRLMLAGASVDVVAAQVGADVVVFIDADGGDAPDLALRLVGARLDQLGIENFI